MLEKHLIEKSTIVDENGKKPWKIEASSTAKNCKNKIREIVDNLNLAPNPSKNVIALSIGDPTVYGNLKPPSEAIQAVLDAVQSGDYNGYAPCMGYESSRKAVANYLSHDGVEFTLEDIILCSGCSSSLEISIIALCDEKRKQNVLVPRPGFSIYLTLAETMGVVVKTYDLIAEQNWQVDLEHLRAQVDENTAAIIINNPSNPCGSVYTAEHLRDILEIAYMHRIPVIADEIYEQIVFHGNTFVSMASLDSGVPLLICGGLAKRFIAPGWRLGWIAIHDPNGYFNPSIRKALSTLTQRTIGSNTLIQGALDGILFSTPQSYHDNLVNFLERNANLAFGILRKVEGLVPYKPQGTMYMMVKVNMQDFLFTNISDFLIKLMEEESVFSLPGTCFQLPDFMRIVLTVPEDLMLEACGRIADFCARQLQNKQNEV